MLLERGFLLGGHEHGGVGVVARIVPAHRPFLPRDVCRPRFDVATFIANEDSLDCRGLRRGEGLRLLRWPTAPSSSMGSIRMAAGTLGSISGFPSVAPERNKTTPGPTRFGFVAKSVLLGPEPE